MLKLGLTYSSICTPLFAQLFFKAVLRYNSFPWMQEGVEFSLVLSSTGWEIFALGFMMLKYFMPNKYNMLLVLILSTEKKQQCSFLEHVHFLLLHENNSSHFTKCEPMWVKVKTKIYTENKNWCFLINSNTMKWFHIETQKWTRQSRLTLQYRFVNSLTWLAFNYFRGNSVNVS